MTKWITVVAVALVLLLGCSTQTAPAPYAITNANQLQERGVTLYERGEYSDAMMYFSRAASEYQSLNQQKKLLVAQQNMAEAAFLVAQYEFSEHAAAVALKLATEQGDSASKVRASLTLARVYIAQQKYLQAQKEISIIQAALVDERNRMRKAPRDWSALERSALLTLAQFTLLTEPQNTQWLEQANQPSLFADNPLYHARYLRLIYAQKQHVNALEQALSIYTSQGFRPGIATCLEAFAAHYSTLEQKEDALNTYRRALYVRLALNDAHHTHFNLMALSALYEEMEQPEVAIQYRELAQRLVSNTRIMTEIRDAL